MRDYENGAMERLNTHRDLSEIERLLPTNVPPWERRNSLRTLQDETKMELSHDNILEIMTWPQHEKVQEIQVGQIVP